MGGAVDAVTDVVGGVLDPVSTVAGQIPVVGPIAGPIIGGALGGPLGFASGVAGQALSGNYSNGLFGGTGSSSGGGGGGTMGTGTNGLPPGYINLFGSPIYSFPRNPFDYSATQTPAPYTPIGTPPPASTIARPPTTPVPTRTPIQIPQARLDAVFNNNSRPTPQERRALQDDSKVKFKDNNITNPGNKPVPDPLRRVVGPTSRGGIADLRRD